MRKRTLFAHIEDGPYRCNLFTALELWKCRSACPKTPSAHIVKRSSAFGWNQIY
jgi:hypothetical protein